MYCFVCGHIGCGKFVAHLLCAVRLLDQLRERIRRLRYCLQTEKAYLY